MSKISDTIHHANPFADQGPFLIFYEIYNEVRYYRVRGKGCATRNPLEATRYEIKDYDELVRSSAFERPLPNYACLPVSICLPSTGQPKVYLGRQRILEGEDIALPYYGQAVQAASAFAKPLLKSGGPYGSCIQLGPDDHVGRCIAHVTTELFFFPQDSKRIPNAIRGFSRLSANHFKGNQGTPPAGVVIDEPKDKLADKQTALSAGAKNSMGTCLFLTSIPEGLNDWCNEWRIEGRLWETYDGGGFTGYMAEFVNEYIRNQAAGKCQGSVRHHQHLLGEGITLVREF